MIDSSYHRMRRHSSTPPPPGTPRSVQSMDRDMRGYYHTARPSRDRRQSLPHPPTGPHGGAHYSATAPRMGKRGMMTNGSSPTFKHWGSSLSLESDPSLGEVRSRTLRRPSPPPSRSREPIPRTVKPVLPLLTQEEVKHPNLRDYLEKPRMVSTLHCVKPSASEHHAKRLANGEVPVYRQVERKVYYYQSIELSLKRARNSFTETSDWAASWRERMLSRAASSYPRC